MKPKSNQSRACHRQSARPTLTAAAACVAAVFFQSACSTVPVAAVQPSGPATAAVPVSTDENPVIFIHGTMGSRLQDADSGRYIWGNFSRRDANGVSPEAIRGMALPMQRGRSLESLRDSTVAVGNLDFIHLRLLEAIPLDVSVYGDTRKLFRDVDGEDSVSAGRRLDFVYDWRRSCDENARLFARFVAEMKADLVDAHGFPGDMKFDVVAHSQGSMILDYFLRYGDARLPEDGSIPALTWAGARHIGKVVLLGPPNRGVGPTLEYLTSGHKAHYLLPKYEAAVVGTMPSLYQMLPRAADGVLLDPATGKVLNPLDYDLWVSREWGLANPEQDKELQLLLPDVGSRAERRAIALDHLRKCLAKARQFQQALDRPASPPAHLRTVICAGNTIKTMVGFTATRRHLKVARTEMGDGTVAIYSALNKAGVGRETTFFDCEHLDLATDTGVHRYISACLAPGGPAALAKQDSAGQFWPASGQLASHD